MTDCILSSKRKSKLTKEKKKKINKSLKQGENYLILLWSKE